MRFSDHVALVDVPLYHAMKASDHVAVADDQPGGQHHLAHVVEMPHGDEIFQVETACAPESQASAPSRNPEDRAGDEVRRENRRVPAGNNAEGEIKADDGVHRNNQRRRQPRKQQRRRFVAMPVHRRSAPAHGQNAVDRSWRRGSSRGPAAWPGPGPARRTRTAATPLRRSKPRSSPTPAGCGTAATASSCWDTETASRQPRAAQVQQRKHARAGHGEQASWLRRSG